jgi:hypothetical protein
MSLNFPLRHISIRVPWHDSGWNGTVCADPAQNTACQLKNIFDKKEERGTFMAPFGFDRFHQHPYRKPWR